MTMTRITTYEDLLERFVCVFQWDTEGGVDRDLVKEALFEVFEEAYRANLYYSPDQLYLDVLVKFPNTYKRSTTSWTHELEHWVTVFDAWWFATDNYDVRLLDRTDDSS